MSDDIEKVIRYARLSEVFTPGAPVASRDRFAGRSTQVMKVLSGITQPGAQVVMYGERGVGKTSLANVLSEFLTPLQANKRVVRVNCTTGDKFTSIWKKVFDELDIEAPEAWTYATPDPDNVRRKVETVPGGAVIILDEYDRMEDEEGLSLMADLLKSFSDYNVPTKIVIVGVADSIDQLVGEHESVQRALVEVQMPRMSQDELGTIIDSGLAAATMTIDPVAKKMVGRLAEGLPYFVHQLLLISAQRAVVDDRSRVEVTDVEAAIQEATQRHTLMNEYQTAIQSPRTDNLYARVLVACALAEKNALGFFPASAVREPLSKMMGRPYDIPAFARHLNAFTELDRGSVLTKHGTERRYTYRFRNPMLQSFALLNAVAEGILPDDFRKALLED